MIKKQIEIRNETGLHTRPGNEFVKRAKAFQCAVAIEKAGRESDAKSLLKLMKANIVKGDVVVLRCDGPDEEAAIAELGAFLAALEE